MTTSMEITVLGSSASSPDSGDACAGYLVRHGQTELLVDCGSGVVGKLREHTTVERLTAIVISHFHPDHFLDLITLRYGLRYGFGEPVRPRLIVPPGGIEHLTAIGVALRNQPAYFTGSYELEEYEPAGELSAGDLRLRFCRTTHDIPTYAMAIGGSGRTLVYTADTRESAELETFAANADLLLCESTYPESDGAPPSGNHLTSIQAGELGRRAGARRLVLTHFWPGIERSCFAREAERTFGAPVEIARSGLRLTI